MTFDVPEYPIEENPFSTLMVDITHRCNMKCNNCYLPNRYVPDLEVEEVIDALARLPKRTSIRLAGAEPTLHPHLPEIVSRIRSLGHRPIVLTNGLKVADCSYLADLKAAGLRRIYISMNGADRDDWYQAIDGMRCADRKLQALRNCIDLNMVISTGSILVPTVNDGVLKRMVRLVENLGPRSVLLRFKSVGQIGRYMNGTIPSLNLDEMITRAVQCLGVDRSRVENSDTIDGQNEKASRLFPLSRFQHSGRGIWIKLSDWTVDKNGLIDPYSTRRGRFLSHGVVAPFFEHIRANEGGY